MLGQPVKYTDMESEDYAFYQGLVFLLENNVADLGYDLYFSTEARHLYLNYISLYMLVNLYSFLSSVHLLITPPILFPW